MPLYTQGHTKYHSLRFQDFIPLDLPKYHNQRKPKQTIRHAERDIHERRESRSITRPATKPKVPHYANVETVLLYYYIHRSLLLLWILVLEEIPMVMLAISTRWDYFKTYWLK